MNQDIEDALRRLRHAIDNSPPQASQLSDADARTASALAQGRIAELEEQVVKERSRGDKYLGEIGDARLLLKHYADGGLIDAIRALLADLALARAAE